MEQTPVPPILMGVYRYARLMTSTSEPTILGVLPGRVWLVGQDGLFFDAPTQAIRAKASKTVGHVTLEVDGGKHVLAGIGSASGAPFSEQQLAELAASRPAVEGHPASHSLMAGRALYVGAPGKVDGAYQGGVQSIVGREIGQQREIGTALRELLTAVGVSV